MIKVTHVTSKIVLLFSFFILSIVSDILYEPKISMAHGGGLDSFGGHNCNVGSCAETYHCHREPCLSGTGSPTSETPDYETQGTSNGQKDAIDKTAYITSKAEANGSNQGLNDANQGNQREQDFRSIPSALMVCDVEPTFTSPQNNDYTQAYRESYSEKCNEIYADVFMTSYERGYNYGEQSNRDNDDMQQSDTSNAPKESSSNYGWIIAGSAAVFIGAMTVFFKDQKYRK